MDNNYIYIINNKDFLKFKNNKNKCIPFTNNRELSLEDISINKILIYIQSSIFSKKQGFIGSFKIKNIIKKNIDNDYFNKLLSYYDLYENNIYFLECDEIIFYEDIITMYQINKYLKKENKKFFTISKNIEIYDLYLPKTNNLFNTIDYLINQEKNIKEVEIIESEKITFQIPILWIPCTNLKQKLDKCKVSFKLFKNHYKKCINCEIVNNNKLDLEFDIKILFKHTNNNDEIKNIINSYNSLTNFNKTELECIDYEYDTTKINIIYCRDKNHSILYSNCLFILTQ